MILYTTYLHHMTLNPSTILHRTYIVHVVIEIVIEITKRNLNIMNKIFNYKTTIIHDHFNIQQLL